MENKFAWQCHPKAALWIEALLERACQKNFFIESLKQDLLKKASTKLFDWVDHIVLGYSREVVQQLDGLGFTEERTTITKQQFIHEGALFPAIILDEEAEGLSAIALKVESIEDFLMVRGMDCPIAGSFFSGYRKADIYTEEGVTLSVIERRANKTFEPVYEPHGYIERYLQAKELWKRRPRALQDMQITLEVAEKIAESVGRDLAACLILACEREYWQSKNRAAQIQYARQNQLGLGWANHDHHTFRSSRGHFKDLVRLFEILGFHCRERYYAGKEGGWGAQIMENKRAALILFLDVDLKPDEVDIDFAHERLKASDHLGTVGLWCTLHGDSILKAGMHHLEAQFSFDTLKNALDTTGVKMMDPFSNFPFLKQAFTKGEKWEVDPLVLKALVHEKKLTQEQADQFAKEGAIGSHLENLERKEGYKGFNQKNVTTIIQKTDPRLIKD
jgi:hypothetical protein